MEITSSPEVKPGASLKTKLTLKLEESARMWHGGIEFHAGPRPCRTRSFVIAKHNVFCEGDFEKGTYIRERSFKLSPRLVPTFIDRHVTYNIKAEVTIKKGEFNASMAAETPVFVKTLVPRFKPTESNPVAMSLRGLKVSLNKDRFYPGEDIPIEFDAPSDIQSLSFSLVKQAQILCECHYRNVCSFIKPMASQVIESSKTHEKKGIISLRIPSDAELTHNYSWASAEKGYLVQSFGDNVNWFVSVSGRRTSGEEVQSNVDFEIVSESEPFELPLVVPREEPEDFTLEMLKPGIRILTGKRNDDGFVFRLRNQGETLEGTTVRMAGIKEELFEISPWMIGVTQWEKDEALEAFYPMPKSVKELREFQLQVESNNRDVARLRHVLGE